MSFYPAYRSILGPASRALFRVAGLFDTKIARGLEMRRPREGRPAWKIEPLGRPVWIHCASGEFEYAKPIVTRLKAKNVPVLVTYFSPTYVDVITKFPGVTGVVPLPWDIASEMEAFIDHHRPRVLLVARTDVWPEMARVAREKSLPSLLFSATLTASSGRARGLGRWMARAVLSQLDSIWCVSDDDQKVFEAMGLKAEVKGDSRFDQVKARLAAPKPVRDELFADDPRPIFIAGSTWNEDETVLIEVAKRFEKEIRFVFVPHEPTDAHLQELEKRLGDGGLSSVRYSSATSWTEGVLLVDRVGLLAELYLKGRFGFVGGSFRKTVHSVMEPLGAGALTFVGPLHLNNREALELKTITSIGELKCVEAVSSAAEMTERLRLALAADPERLKAKIHDEVEARTGASDHVIEWIIRSCERVN
ncbi:MAG: glycosyltransferase N-terminal domain-containing protein [Bdellovibrionota bacterium]